MTKKEYEEIVRLSKLNIADKTTSTRANYYVNKYTSDQKNYCNTCNNARRTVFNLLKALLKDINSNDIPYTFRRPSNEWLEKNKDKK